MIKTSQNTLKNISALVWIIGGIVLLLKAISLFTDAHSIIPELTIIIIVVLAALFAGLLKSKFIMAKFCKNNLIRIYNIKNPKIYQFFENKFFFWLMVMIITGITLSRLALGNYSCLLAVGGLDFSLSVALFTSSLVFIKKSKYQEK